MIGIISAVVDSGSPTTIISEADIKKMRISRLQLDRLDGKVEDHYLGGAKIKAKVLPNVSIKIGGLDVQMPVHVPIEKIDSNPNPKTDEQQLPPPTILGVDFLIQAKLKFYFDPTNKESYFETL